ncbi:MAG: hypothetical protein ACK47B_20200 [Armatimonadota bacterium]
MRYYLRRGPGERIEGPYFPRQLQAMHAEAPFPPEAEVLEARGQSAFTLRRSRDWSPVGELLLLPPPTEDEEEPPPPEPGTVRARRLRRLVSRYQHAYFTARVAVNVGMLLVVLGGVAAIVVFFTVLSFTNRVLSPPFGDLLANRLPGPSAGDLFWTALLSAVQSGCGIALLGLLVTAAGHFLSAALDRVVQASPFLNDDQRVEIMSL